MMHTKHVQHVTQWMIFLRNFHITKIRVYGAWSKHSPILTHSLLSSLVRVPHEPLLHQFNVILWIPDILMITKDHRNSQFCRQNYLIAIFLITPILRKILFIPIPISLQVNISIVLCVIFLYFSVLHFTFLYIFLKIIDKLNILLKIC